MTGRGRSLVWHRDRSRLPQAVRQRRRDSDRPGRGADSWLLGRAVVSSARGVPGAAIGCRLQRGREGGSRGHRDHRPAATGLEASQPPDRLRRRSAGRPDRMLGRCWNAGGRARNGCRRPVAPVPARPRTRGHAPDRATSGTSRSLPTGSAKLTWSSAGASLTLRRSPQAKTPQPSAARPVYPTGPDKRAR
jgi:hypothetical protein